MASSSDSWPLAAARARALAFQKKTIIKREKIQHFSFFQIRKIKVDQFSKIHIEETMDLDVKIRANDQGLFVVTFFNELNPEKNLTERAVKYIFSKFGSVSEIQYTEHGRVLISYKEKEGALKAIEMVNMGTKYRVETWQPVKENEVVQSTKSEEEDSFIYLRLPPKEITGGNASITIRKTLFGFLERSKLKYIVFSWIFHWHVKIVFDSKMSKDEIMTRHQENPFKWPKGYGNFEFCEDVPIAAYIRCPKPNMSDKFCYFHVKNAIFGIDSITNLMVQVDKNTTKLMKVIFDEKITKDEAIEAHKRKPFMWPDNLGVFEFLSASEALSIHEQGKGGKKKED